MTLSAIHNMKPKRTTRSAVVCDIGGYDFVSYSQPNGAIYDDDKVVCDIGGYDFVSYSQRVEFDIERVNGCL